MKTLASIPNSRSPSIRSSQHIPPLLSQAQDLTIDGEMCWGLLVVGQHDGVLALVLRYRLHDAQHVAVAVADNLDAVRGCEGLAVLHPAHFDVGFAKQALQLNILSLRPRHITQGGAEVWSLLCSLKNRKKVR